ncbi:MAG: TRAP-type C4-dicarboxylate transport system substrate-binding protein [Paracoccaceae bacterium]|jgi:TRAP-type C4-dicarboxylate transport system substrate-binding protein
MIRGQAAGALGRERDLIEGLQIGSVKLVRTCGGPLGAFVPDVLALDLRFQVVSDENAHKIRDGEIGR